MSILVSLISRDEMQYIDLVISMVHE
jgi:hypothetical protein